MKLGTPIFLLLLIAFVFTAVALIVADFRVAYPNAGNVSTSYESKYNYITDVNSSLSGISSDIQKIGDEENGWKRILGGLMVFLKAVITSILAILFAIPYLISITSGIGNDLGVPPQIVAIGIVTIMASVILMLIKFVNKSPSY